MFNLRSSRNLLSLFTGALLFIAAVLFTAQAQSTTATLSGTVTDEKGAVIPSAIVTVENIDTRLRRQATTNGEGSFTIPLLPPSTYLVRVEGQGFATAQIPSVVLNVNDQVALNIRLKLGQVSTETVNISDKPSLIDESPSVSTVVDRQFVENLPLNGRSFQALITLTPGIVLTKTNVNEQGQFSVNGQRANANYFTIDGVSANVGIGGGSGLGQSGSGSLPSLSAAGGTNNLVSIDALQEFKIQTSTYAPEFGRSPGGQVQIITRSGTNELRGTLFEYFRNDVLDANNWFANANRLAKPTLRQNDFGGVLGGPIVKNRTFFFISYEGLRLRQPQVGIITVPSITARQAAPARIQPFLNAYPVPNGTVFTNGLAQFSASFSNPSTLNATSIRVDHTISEKLTLFGRYSYAPSDTAQRGITNSVLNTSALFESNTQTLTIGATQSISQSVSNDFRANYSKSVGSLINRLDNFGGAVVPDDSVLFPPFASSKDSLLSFNTPGAQTLFVGKNAKNVQRQLNFVDNLAVTAVTHQLKFGIDYRRLMPTGGPRKYNQSVTFTGIGPISTGTAPPSGTVVSGIASSVRINAQEIVDVLVTNFSAYGQDTWKIRPRMTFTYGLRWEINPAPRGKNGQDLFTVIGLDNPATLALAPTGTPLWKITYNNLAPRFGIAYRLSEHSGRETMLRAGGGVFYDLGAGQIASDASFWPYSRAKTLTNVSYPLDQTQAAPPPFNTTPSSVSPVAQMYVADPSLELPRTYQWNVSLEQSLGSSQSVSASYVAALGRRLLRTDALAFPNPNFQFVFVMRNAATSDYHAMQIQFQRRLSQGLQALASYTWAHSIDIASNDSGQTPAVGFVDVNSDRGSSDFDVRHSFSGAVTYNIPAPATPTLSSVVLRNWAVDSIMVARSAAPVDLIGRSLSNGFFSNLRPDLVFGQSVYISDSSAPGGRRFNKVAFVAPPIGPGNTFVRQGTLGRNVLRGFPVWQIDIALRRQFNLTERMNLQFRVELFNIFNHPNFGDPVNNINNGLFGQSTQMLGSSLGGGGFNGGFSSLYQIGGPRSVQLSLKLNF